MIAKHGVRGPLAGSFAVAAVGMFLLSRVGEHGSYLTDVLPGMLIAGVRLASRPCPSRWRSSPAHARKRAA